jgi:hypothetical protein
VAAKRNDRIEVTINVEKATSNETPVTPTSGYAKVKESICVNPSLPHPNPPNGTFILSNSIRVKSAENCSAFAEVLLQFGMAIRQKSKDCPKAKTNHGTEPT